MINLVLNSILIIYLPFKKAHVGVQGHTVKGDSKGGSKILKERGVTGCGISILLI
jgi:hypothetical protein